MPELPPLFDESRHEALKEAFEKFVESNDHKMENHRKMFQVQADKTANLQEELELLKTMRAPASSDGGDNQGILDAITKIIDKLKERLNERISEIAYQLDLLVRKDTFETAIADLNERKADRADLDALKADLENMIKNIDIPAPVVQRGTPVEIPAAYDGVILTQDMVNRWDAMASELDKLRASID